MKICFATHNLDKLKEIKALLPPRFSILSLEDLGIHDDIEEKGDTLEENSKIKAVSVYEKIKMPVFADDSGLEVAALNGAPGVWSARYAGAKKDNDANMSLLLDNMKNCENRNARFKTVITYIDSPRHAEQFEGIVEGVITHTQMGTQGFGYDPIFMPKGHATTFGQMSPQLKNQLSHRGRAFTKLIAFLVKKKTV